MMNLDDELDNKEPVSKKKKRERERDKEREENLSRFAAKEIQKNHPPIHHLLNQSILVENFKNVEKSVKLSLGELLLWR